MKKRLILLFALLLATSCAAGLKFNYTANPEVTDQVKTSSVIYPDAKFIAFSDAHFYDTSLGTTGKAFEDYLEDDRKLLSDSLDILDSAVEAMSQEKADFVIIPGDLTKDGEKSGHMRFSEYLKKLEQSGKKVFVIPGNHDINNSYAVKYLDDKTERVENITPDEFSEIYKDYGYSEALYRDKDSLSYVAEPVPGLWLLAMDACRYRENENGNESVTAGRFNDSTLSWIEAILAKAVEQKKAVIGFMHHGILEHYEGQKKYYGAYVVENNDAVAKMFASYGMKMVFTGHYHAQDITKKSWKDDSPNRFLFDIETGSLLTYPCPYRIATISDNQINIKTIPISSTKNHKDLTEYSKNYVYNGIKGIATDKLKGYGLSQEDADIMAPQIADAFIAHYAGDEKVPEEILKTNYIGIWAGFIINMQKDLVYGLWHDINTPDNNVTINLTNGEAK